MKEQIRGSVDLADTAFEQAVNHIEKIHLAIADEPFQVLDKVPVMRQVSGAVHRVHDDISSLNYQLVRVGGQTVFSIARYCLDKYRTRV